MPHFNTMPRILTSMIDLPVTDQAILGLIRATIQVVRRVVDLESPARFPAGDV